jgi:hypothetical protein
VLRVCRISGRAGRAAVYPSYGQARVAQRPRMQVATPYCAIICPSHLPGFRFLARQAPLAQQLVRRRSKLAQSAVFCTRKGGSQRGKAIRKSAARNFLQKKPVLPRPAHAELFRMRCYLARWCTAPRVARPDGGVAGRVATAGASRSCRLPHWRHDAMITILARAGRAQPGAR